MITARIESVRESDKRKTLVVSSDVPVAEIMDAMFPGEKYVVDKMSLLDKMLDFLYYLRRRLQ